MSVTVTWQGQELVLLSERAVFWPALSMILVADLHIGKGSTFRAAGVPIPTGSSEATLDRLSSLMVRLHPARLAVLGDLFHGAEANIEVFRTWVAGHPSLQVEVIAGNHDRWVRLADLGLGSQKMVEYEGLVLAHQPLESNCPVICGHIHPGFRLESRVRSERLPCFWMQRSCLILPAFGEFTGLHMIERAKSDRVFIVAGREVLEVPK